ncbi:hypothetical protein ACFWU3_03530 [Streptomyces sp. NPDC058685]|uniref:hypothetical protein n=1 Tax=Streptomyces sp. NPDC058685 TaxID=3346598 RepID=UPI0036540ECF
MVTTGLDRAGAAPKPVRLAYALSLAGTAVELVGWVLGSFVIAPTGWEDLRADRGPSEALVQLAASGGVLIALSAVWLLCAYKMRAGRPWARVVLAVAGALCALWLVNNLTMSGFDVSLAAERTHEVLAVATALLLYLPAANAHFTSRRAQPTC